jgi:hypothetical protein
VKKRNFLTKSSSLFIKTAYYHKGHQESHIDLWDELFNFGEFIAVYKMRLDSRITKLQEEFEQL